MGYVQFMSFKKMSLNLRIKKTWWAHSASGTLSLSVKFPVRSESVCTYLYTHSHSFRGCVTKQQQQQQPCRVWMYHVSSQESVLADVRLALAKEMSDSQP